MHRNIASSFTTYYLLLALAFVLMGKAVSALQEAAIIGMTSLPVSFEIDWIGVKSTWQGVLAQLSVLLVYLVFLILPKSKRATSQPTPQASDFKRVSVTASDAD
jgi:high-affinity iron transporter|tara:strand:+ start:201 stop:512 length:312 start_codon:yes stop_codon:yes gene_type:complete